MISKKIKDLKIATILPYKENYSFEKASAVSLWVSEFYKNSRFKKKNIIFGYTKSNNFLTSLENLFASSFNAKLKIRLDQPEPNSSIVVLLLINTYWYKLYKSSNSGM